MYFYTLQMLEELLPTRQIPGEPRRRWFRSERCDLIVWLRDDGAPRGFQLCYDKDAHEHALTWIEGRGYNHMRVDAGSEREPMENGTPILVPDGYFDPARILEIFGTEGGRLPPEFAGLVLEKLRALVAVEG